MPAVSRVSFALHSWANAALLRGEGEIVESSKNYRNWRRYNRTVDIGPADEFGCVRVTVEWDEDYEFEYVIVIERKPEFGLGLDWGGGGFTLGGRRTYRIGWFTVKGEHHRETGIDCPGDTGLASAGTDAIAVSVGDEVIWSGSESPLVAIVTGGEASPILTGEPSNLTAFVDWLSDTPAPGEQKA